MQVEHTFIERRPAEKPYAMLGAGELVSTLWKTGSEEAGWRYRFNVFRFASGGQVAQMFTPADLKSFLKLTRVLAATLADDGCVSLSERRELTELASSIDRIVDIDDGCDP